jgi:Rieske Fe-S protein
MRKRNSLVKKSLVSEKTGRRDFLTGIWKWLGLVALAELAWLTVSMLRPGKKNLQDNPGALVREIGAVDDFPVNSVTPDRINKIFLVRTEDGGFLALSLICSHLGCSVIWDDAAGAFNCPCHSSSFDRLGNVMNSPAPRALDYYPVLIEAGKVKIDTGRKMKRRKFERNQVTYAI